MDWPRVKSILIIGFLILNLIMAYRLYVLPDFPQDSDQLSIEDKEAIVAVLEKSGMKLNLTLPTEVSRMPVLNIRVRSLSAVEISTLKESLLGPSALQTSLGAVPSRDHAVRFVNGQEELLVNSLGYVTYNNWALAETSDQIMAEEARTIADEFLRDKLGNTKDFIYDSISIDPFGYRVDYVQKHKDSYMFPGYIEMVVKSSGVAHMYLCRLEVDPQFARSKSVVAPHQALLSLLSHQLNTGGVADIEITRLQLGFYSRMHDSDMAFPAVAVWKIGTSVGDFYFNALSGVYEQ